MDNFPSRPHAVIRTLRKEDWFHPDGFPLVVARREPQEPFGLHSHEFAEIVIITGGTGLYDNARGTLTVTAKGLKPRRELLLFRLSG